MNKVIGSRAEVWHGNAKKTRGGLTKKDLFKKKVALSQSVQAVARREQNN